MEERDGGRASGYPVRQGSGGSRQGGGGGGSAGRTERVRRFLAPGGPAAAALPAYPVPVPIPDAVAAAVGGQLPWRDADSSATTQRSDKRARGAATDEADPEDVTRHLPAGVTRLVLPHAGSAAAAAARAAATASAALRAAPARPSALPANAADAYLFGWAANVLCGWAYGRRQRCLVTPWQRSR